MSSYISTSPPLIVYSNGEELQIEWFQWTEFSRDYKQVDAAGGLVRSGAGEYLFIFRNGCWDLPKGKCEPGESVPQAALREVREECGIAGLQLGNLLTATYHTYTLHGENILKRTFWYAMSCAEEHPALTPQTEEGITIAEFVSHEKMLRLAADSYPTIRQVIAAADNAQFTAHSYESRIGGQARL